MQGGLGLQVLRWSFDTLVFMQHNHICISLNTNHILEHVMKHPSSRAQITKSSSHVCTVRGCTSAISPNLFCQWSGAASIFCSLWMIWIPKYWRGDSKFKSKSKFNLNLTLNLNLAFGWKMLWSSFKKKKKDIYIRYTVHINFIKMIRNQK